MTWPRLARQFGGRSVRAGPERSASRFQTWMTLSIPPVRSCEPSGVEDHRSDRRVVPAAAEDQDRFGEEVARRDLGRRPVRRSTPPDRPATQEAAEPGELVQVIARFASSTLARYRETSIRILRHRRRS